MSATWSLHVASSADQDPKSVEAQCLEKTSTLAPFENATCSIRTPRLQAANFKGQNQIMEYVPNGTNLKAYALKFYAPPTDEASKPQCLDLGRGLGGWLRSFHNWANLPEQASFREIVSGNKELQTIRHAANYGAIVRLVDRFPSLLSDSRELFAKVRDATAEELLHDAKLQPIHGDYWTGK